MSTKKKLGIWIRVSTDIQLEADSLENIGKCAQMWANFHEYDVVGVSSLETVSDEQS